MKTKTSVSPKSAQTRLKELKTMIKSADEAYYQQSDPILTDPEYDALISELRALEKENPDLITPDSPSHRIGEKLTAGFSQHKHLYPMLSIDNVYTYEDLDKWYKDIIELVGVGNDYVIVQPKIDGIAISLTYKNGKLIRGTTRGDGEVGDDVTANCMAVLDIPLTISYKEEIEVRGECYISISDFERINIREEANHKNPRNLVNGTMKSHDPIQVRNRMVRFICHSVGHLGVSMEYDTLSSILRMLVKSGMIIAAWSRTSGFLEFKSLVDGYVSGNENRDIPVDGVVVKLDSIDAQTHLGHGSKYVKWAIAYKPRESYAETTLESITWTVGKNGKLTPVANLTPVDLDGTTITHASLHNHMIMYELQIEPGCVVRLEKAGEIIPQIVARVNTRHKDTSIDYYAPMVCPICNSTLELVGPNLFCRNSSCPGQTSSSLKHFVSKTGLDIKGIGDVLIERIGGIVILPEHLWTHYNQYIQMLEGLGNWGQRSTDKLYAGLQEAKSCGLEKFLRALGIPKLGKTLSKALAARYDDIDDLCQNITIDKLKEIEHIGDTIAELVYPVLSSPSFKARVDVFKSQGFNLRSLSRQAPEVIDMANKAKQSKLTGKSICVTGSVEGYTRAELEAKLTELGASFNSGVSKSTDILVIGDDPGSAKIEKANKYNIPTITSDELLKLFSSP